MAHHTTREQKSSQTFQPLAGCPAVFLETLHYGVWLIALPLIGSRGVPWDVKTIPLFRHPRGFPRTVALLLVLGLVLVMVLWFGFAIDYAAARDIYFAVAIAHVLAEAPFLMRSL
jgi:hypothetical protein